MDTISRPSLSEIVAGKIAGMILDEVYRSGYQLPAERDLVKQFGISRSTLREALKLLEDSALIEVRHGVGSFVAELTEAELNAELEKGYADMVAGRTKPARQAFADIRKDYGI